MLSERWPVQLLGRDEWRPFPTADDRAGWEALSPETKDAFVRAGVEAIDAPWPRLKATHALEFVRTGDRGAYEGPHFIRRGILRDLALAECVEDSGRFLDAIVDGVWSICEETWWGWSAATGHQRCGPGLPDVTEQYFDLGAGESVALMAWVRYLLRDRLDGVSPLIAERIEYEAKRRIIDPFLERDDYWWAKGSSNWNTWCHSNALVSTLLLEPDDARRAAVVAKGLAGLDVFVAAYPADGGCDEGPTYWTRAGGALFESLELLSSATDGAYAVWDEPLIGEIARFILRAHIAGDWYVNFADGAARIKIPGPAVFRFGRAIGDQALGALGAEASRRAYAEDPRMADGFNGNPTRTLPALFGRSEWMADEEEVPLLRDVWLPDIEVMTARDRADDATGLFVAAKGGHNDEHHNHNDVGNFVVYVDGQPIIIDAGVGMYTAKTFGAERYEIWTMQSAWHNTPVVNGVEQQAGPAFRSRDVAHSADDERAELRLDLAAAYPAAAGIDSWTRTISLVRGSRVEVIDEYGLTAGADDRNYRRAIAIHLLAAGDVSLAGEGRVQVVSPEGTRATIEFDPLLLEPALDVKEVDAENLRMVWGDAVTRIRLQATNAASQGSIAVAVAPA